MVSTTGVAEPDLESAANEILGTTPATMPAANAPRFRNDRRFRFFQSEFKWHSPQSSARLGSRHFTSAALMRFPGDILAPMAKSSGPAPVRALGPLSLTAIAVNSVVGAGIF